MGDRVKGFPALDGPFLLIRAGQPGKALIPPAGASVNPRILRASDSKTALLW